jgi:hypothetical protein
MGITISGQMGTASITTPKIAPYAEFPQWLERVRGESMNKVLPDGCLAHVVDAIALGYTPRHEDLVVVVRRRAQGSFEERSIKQVALTPEGPQLWPRSYDPRWTEPLSLTNGVSADQDLEVEIVGKVVRAYMTFGE